MSELSAVRYKNRKLYKQILVELEELYRHPNTFNRNKAADNILAIVLGQNKTSLGVSAKGCGRVQVPRIPNSNYPAHSAKGETSP